MTQEQPEVQISELTLAIADLCIARGEHPLTRYEGCWECDVDEHWWLAVNAHAQEVVCSRGIPVPSMKVYIEFNGWPAGFIGVAGGGVMAAGALANEDALFEAIQEATRRAGA